MLQLAAIRENEARILAGLRKRNFHDGEELIRQVTATDQQRKDIQKEADDLKAKSNTDAKKIGELIKSGKAEEANALRIHVASDKQRIKSLEDSLAVQENRLQELLYKIPNVPAEKVPAGKSPDDNLTVHEYGKMPSLGADAQPHWELIKKYDIIDFDLGNKISGAGFPVYKGKG